MNIFGVFPGLMVVMVAMSKADTDIEKAFGDLELSPQIIPVAPKLVATISYPNDVSVNLGAELTPTQVKDMPSVAWQAEKGALYTLMMFDADSPSRQKPIAREHRHWMVINIPECMVNDGVTVAEYVGSGPGEATAIHRYVFLVYKQNGPMEYNGIISSNRYDNDETFFIR